MNRKVAATLLKKRGHQVVVAEDGLKALDLFERESFDLILMDLQMPEMGGARSGEGNPSEGTFNRAAHPDRRHDGPCRSGGSSALP